MTAKLFDLTGKVAVVTGSSKGIGKGIAEQMAAHGANVVVSSRSQADSEAVAAAINEAEGREAAIGVACDIAKDEDLQGIVNAAIEKWGRLDSLVCNALVPPTGVDLESQSECSNVNIWSNVRLCELAKPHLEKSDRASIVAIGSIAGLNQPCQFGGLWYSVCKAAWKKIVVDLATEWAGDRITVNYVCPGLTRSNMTEGVFLSSPELTAKVSAAIPLGRPAEPEEIAGQVIYCASEAGASITGQSIAVNGGYMTCHPDLLGKVFEEQS